MEKEVGLSHERYFSEKWASEAKLSYFIESQLVRSILNESFPFRNERYAHFRLSAKHYILPATSKQSIFVGLGFGGRYAMNDSNLRRRENFFTKGSQVTFTNNNNRMLGLVLQQGGQWRFLDDQIVLELESAILLNLIDFNRRADAFLSLNVNVGYAF
ncbi:MAG: hypothetical protein AAF849_17330 [Bacteroidota bacterium]